VTIAAVAIAAIGSVAIGAGDSDDSAHLTTVHNANDRRRLFFDDCLFSSASPKLRAFRRRVGRLAQLDGIKGFLELAARRVLDLVWQELERHGYRRSPSGMTSSSE
jgi:hypothetical protein